MASLVCQVEKKASTMFIPIPQARERDLLLIVFQQETADASLGSA
jgi:hypothetical protein